MNKVTSCPICSGNQFIDFLSVTDYSVSKHAFTISECKGCSFRFTNPIPTEEKIGDYYKFDAYVSHSDDKTGIINSLYHLVRKYTLGKKYRLLRGYIKRGNLLDIGSGTGYFLSYMKDKGWQVSGLEPDEQARRIATEKHGFSVNAPSFMENISANSFDVITMWHVLEHVYHLKKDVKKIAEMLKPEGVLFVAVPNCASYDAKKYGKYWAGYDVPRHLYHFRKQDIKTLFDAYGMEVKAILPMVFDSFYVSLLSEKYKSNVDSIPVSGLIRGFYHGFITYLKSFKGHSSSQIYVIQHKKG